MQMTYIQSGCVRLSGKRVRGEDSTPTKPTNYYQYIALDPYENRQCIASLRIDRRRFNMKSNSSPWLEHHIPQRDSDPNLGLIRNMPHTMRILICRVDRIGAKFVTSIVSRTILRRGIEFGCMRSSSKCPILDRGRPDHGLIAVR